MSTVDFSGSNLINIGNVSCETIDCTGLEYGTLTINGDSIYGNNINSPTIDCTGTNSNVLSTSLMVLNNRLLATYFTTRGYKRINLMHASGNLSVAGSNTNLSVPILCGTIHTRCLAWDSDRANSYHQQHITSRIKTDGNIESVVTNYKSLITQGLGTPKLEVYVNPATYTSATAPFNLTIKGFFKYTTTSTFYITFEGFVLDDDFNW